MERLSGKIITNKELFECKTLPRLDTLSRGEIEIIKKGFSLKKFSVIDLLKSGIGSLDVEKTISSLITKNYIIEIAPETFTLSSSMLFSKLSTVNIFDKPVLEHTAYDIKEEEVINIDDCLNEVKKFTSVIDYEECHILRFEEQEVSK